MTNDNEKKDETYVRPEVLTYEDVAEMVPKLKGHRKLVERLLHWLSVDKVNAVHERWHKTPGPEFTKHLLFDSFHNTLRVDGKEVLEHLPKGAFITVSNHPLGAIDGIALIYLITLHRPEFRVMVNMILNRIQAMRPNFIAVDAWSQDDPEKKRQSVLGIRQALRMLAHGEPVGFFPAGALSKINWKNQLEDREWQRSVLEIIYRAKVPVIPIYFHDRNSWWCNFLGVVCWPARSLRLPAEVFRKNGKELHISVGEPISPEEQRQHGANAEELGKYLRMKTYELREKYGK